MRHARPEDTAIVREQTGDLPAAKVAEVAPAGALTRVILETGPAHTVVEALLTRDQFDAIAPVAGDKVFIALRRELTIPG